MCATISRDSNAPPPPSVILGGNLKYIAYPLIFHCHPFLPRVPNILEYQRGPLMAGLSDRSAYVRRTAVMGIVKIFYFAPELITG